MPTNRTPKRRGGRRGRITPEAIAAWQACDYMALHCALGLRPWEASPLSSEVDALGVSETNPPDPNSTRCYDQTYSKAIKLQRALVAAAGWPDCKTAYEKNLAEAVDWLSYCTEMVRHPERGHKGTGSDPASRRRALAEAEAEVSYRKELLDDLDEHARS
jgi:hypothetical protein